MPFTNVFRLIGKAFKSVTKRPLQRFNIYNRSKNYLGEDSKYFFPAPRAIGPVSKIGPTQYPHLEGGVSPFKSVKQRRIEAIAIRNEKLSASQWKKEDSLVIEIAQKLPVIKTITTLKKSTTTPDTKEITSAQVIEKSTSVKTARPLPKSVNLDMRDPAIIWYVDKVPPGRLDLNKLQELMVNKLADDAYWTPDQIANSYNIKRDYAENIIKYVKQIRVVVSPRLKKILDYTNRTNEAYNATQHIIYVVDPSLRNDLDKSVDKTFLPEDELDEKIRELLNASQTQTIAPSKKETKKLLPKKPLQLTKSLKT